MKRTIKPICSLAADPRWCREVDALAGLGAAWRVCRARVEIVPVAACSGRCHCHLCGSGIRHLYRDIRRRSVETPVENTTLRI